ncbi:FUSC family protein [Actinomadura sp. GC306]|uniref:FUSC family protein n=1 Tax=Actinomadura sp. GC306 TaxID=2530367 RepID=UPI001A9FB6B8|nr:FUSC family protein [Actinomadura sp. GC306]
MRAPSPRTVGRRARSGLAAAGRRALADWWIVLQATTGASLAWGISRYLLDHPAPFFAPVAAIIVLIANLGERGVNAVRIVVGVILGLLVGDIVLITMGTGFGVMAVAVFASVALARAIADPPLVAVQSAVSAILVIAVGDVENGLERLVDALVGTGVALVFTQLLFPPEPLGLLRRAERAALAAIADGLATSARAIAEDDDDLAGQAVGELREVRDHLTELRRAGRASTNVTRRTLAWRARATVIVRETEDAGHLDLLNASCVMLARLVATTGSDARRPVEEPVRELAGLLDALARDLNDAETRQRAADRALEIATQIAAKEVPDETDLAALAHSLGLVATDVITFAGVDQDDAIAAVREGALKERVPAPPTASPRLLGRLKRLKRLWRRRR